MTLVFRKYLLAGVAAVVCFLASGVAVQHHYANRLSVEQDSVAVAHVALSAALVSARAESAWAASQEIVAQGYAASAVREHAKVLALTDTANVLRGRYLAVASTAPAPCENVVYMANALVAGLDSVNSTLRTELDSTRAARDAFHAAADTAQAALAHLAPAVTRLDTAAQGIAKASHEPFWSRVVPKPVVGVFGGVNQSGRPALVVGVGFGWHI